MCASCVFHLHFSNYKSMKMMIISDATFPIIGFMFHRVLLLHIRCPFHYLKEHFSIPNSSLARLCCVCLGIQRLAFSSRWINGTKERKIVHWFKFLREVSFPIPSSLLWLFLLNVYHVDASIVIGVHPQLPTWKWENFGSQRMERFGA